MKKLWMSSMIFLVMTVIMLGSCTSMPDKVLPEDMVFKQPEKIENLPPMEGDEKKVEITIGEAKNAVMYKKAYELLYDVNGELVKRCEKIYKVGMEATNKLIKINGEKKALTGVVIAEGAIILVLTLFIVLR